MRFLKSILKIGVYNNTPKEQIREIVTINFVNTGVLVITLFLLVVNSYYGKFIPAIIELAFIVFGTIPVYYLQNKQQYYFAKIALFVYTSASITLISALAILNHKQVNTDIILIASAAASILYFNNVSKRIVFLAQILLYYSIVAFKFLYWQHKPLNDFIFECINIGVMFYAIYVFIDAFKLFFLDYEKKIIENNKALVNLNNEKDKLFSIIAHDLKSPLGSLNQILAMLAEGQLSKEEFDTLVSKISKNASESSYLLDNLLQWSQSQMKGFKIVRKQLNIHALIQEKIDAATFASAQKNIEIINNCPKEITAVADENMVGIVLRNLLSNAIKFSYKNSKITINVLQENAFVKVIIEDSGIGIADEEMPALFDNIAYTKPGTDNEKGTGLGLVLCKEFIEKNGGQIGVESPIGKGSIFYFTLPMA